MQATKFDRAKYDSRFWISVPESVSDSKRIYSSVTAHVAHIYSFCCGTKVQFPDQPTIDSRRIKPRARCGNDVGNCICENSGSSHRLTSRLKSKWQCMTLVEHHSLFRARSDIWRGEFGKLPVWRPTISLCVRQRGLSILDPGLPIKRARQPRLPLIDTAYSLRHGESVPLAQLMNRCCSRYGNNWYMHSLGLLSLRITRWLSSTTNTNGQTVEQMGKRDWEPNANCAMQYSEGSYCASVEQTEDIVADVDQMFDRAIFASVLAILGPTHRDRFSINYKPEPPSAWPSRFLLQ